MWICFYKMQHCRLDIFIEIVCLEFVSFREDVF